MTEQLFDDDNRNPFMDGDDLEKPEKDDIVVLREMDINIESLDKMGLVVHTHDSLAESWDPVGENAWTQHDVNDAAGFKGHWYAIVTDLGGMEEWSVGSYEVKEIIKKNTIPWLSARLKAFNKYARDHITPEFIKSLDPLQAAWMKEHIEHLMESQYELKDKIEEHLKKRRLEQDKTCDLCGEPLGDEARAEMYDPNSEPLPDGTHVHYIVHPECGIGAGYWIA